MRSDGGSKCRVPANMATRKRPTIASDLMGLTSLRDNETALTEAQQAEEAHLRARFDVFSASPESVARRRREALQDAERQFKKS